MMNPPSPHISQDGEVIEQGFGFTGDFLDEWCNSVYCRVQILSVDSKNKRESVMPVRNAGRK